MFIGCHRDRTACAIAYGVWRHWGYTPVQHLTRALRLSTGRFDYVHLHSIIQTKLVVYRLTLLVQHLYLCVYLI